MADADEYETDCEASKLSRVKVVTIRMGGKKTCRSKLSKLLSLQHQPLEDFVTSQCQKDSFFYPIYRSLVAAYFIVIVVASGVINREIYGFKILIWFTYWAFYSLTLSSILQCFTAWIYRLYWKDLDGELYWKLIPHLLKIQWIIVNISWTITLIISLIFWLAEFDPKTGPTPISINIHAINLILVVLDSCISAHPVKLLHLIHSVIICIVYAIFTLIYWSVGGTNHLNKPYIYKLLDYSGQTNIAILYAILIPIVGAPLCHSFYYFVYHLRTRIYNKVCMKSAILEETVEMDRLTTF